MPYLPKADCANGFLADLWELCSGYYGDLTRAVVPARVK